MHEHAAPKTIVSDSGPTFLQIPLSIVRDPNISALAKLLYGRLALFAGKNGVCNPSHETLASEIGISVRHVKRILAELAKNHLVTWTRRHTSSSYQILQRDRPFSVSNVPELAHLDRPTVAYKKMLMNTGSVKDVDPDCSFSDENEAGEIRSFEGRCYPKLKAALGRYRSGSNNTPPEMLPNDATVAEIMHAANGRSEHWLLLELDHLYFVRGFAWGKRGGPYSWKWFPKVISQRSAEADERERLLTPDEIWDHNGMRRVN